MTKKKYKFNPDTLSYERIGHSIKEKITKILAFFSSSLVFSLVWVGIVIYFYDTPEQKRFNAKIRSYFRNIIYCSKIWIGLKMC